MEPEKDFQHESVEDKESIVKYLQALSEGFRSQKLEFHTGQERILFEPSGLIQVEIKAKSHHRKSKLSLKFVWKNQQSSKGKEKRALSIRVDQG